MHRGGAGIGGQVAGGARGCGALPHGGGQLLHRAGGFLQAGRLLLGAAGEVLVAGSDLRRGGGDRVDARAHGRDHAPQRVDRFREGGLQLAEFVTPGHVNVHGQVTAGHGPQVGHHGGDRAGHRARHQQACRHRDGQAEQRGDDGQIGRAVDGRHRVFARLFHQLFLVGDHLVQLLHVVELAWPQRVEQCELGCRDVIALNPPEEVGLRREVGLALLLQLAEQRPPFRGGDAALEFVVLRRQALARGHQGLDLLVPLRARVHDHQVACDAGLQVDVIADLVDQLDLDVEVVEHFVHVGAHAREAVAGNQRHAGHQQGDEGKGGPEPGADAQVFQGVHGISDEDWVGRRPERAW
mmetsp:Transcript_71804/g.199027  ORF Transcript_71804/g.199027 Transcript_71804/m.199027 type:complete len:353 (-) Transcript_71804:70-1128(-)